MRRRLGLAVVVCAGIALTTGVAYDRYGGIERVFDGETTLRDGGGIFADRALVIRCNRHPLSGDQWRVERPAGAVVSRADDPALREGWRPETAGPAGWSAALPRAGRLRRIDAHWAIVQLVVDDPPCSGLDTATDERDPAWPIDDDGPYHALFGHRTRAEVLARMLDDDDDVLERYGHAWRREIHTHDVGGDLGATWHPSWRLTREPGSLATPPRTICLVDVTEGVRFCVQTEAAAYDRRVVADVLVEVLERAPAVVTGRSTTDGALLWRTVVPTDAAELWLVAAGEGRVGLRANDDYFAIDRDTGELVRVTPEGAEICNVGTLTVAASDGDVSVWRSIAERPRVIAHPGPDWHLVECEASVGRGARVVVEGTRSTPLAAPSRRLGPTTIGDGVPPGPGLVTYAVTDEGSLIGATFEAGRERWRTENVAPR